MRIRTKYIIVSLVINLFLFTGSFPIQSKDYRIQIGIIESEVEPKNKAISDTAYNKFQNYFIKNKKNIYLNNDIIMNIKNKYDSIKKNNDKNIILLGKILNVDYLIKISMYEPIHKEYWLSAIVYPIKKIEIKKIRDENNLISFFDYEIMKEPFKVDQKELVDSMHINTKPMHIQKFYNSIDTLAAKTWNTIKQHYEKVLKEKPKELEIIENDSIVSHKSKYVKILCYSISSIGVTIIAHKIYCLTRQPSKTKMKNEELVPPLFP